MYTVVDPAKFLNGISPLMTNRLKRLNGWNGLLQITLEENSRFFKKYDETVHIFLAANQPLDCKIVLKANTPANILLGGLMFKRQSLTEPYL